MLESPFCEQISDDERIRQLLEDRYISNEATLTQKRRRDNREIARRGELRQRPEAPPPPLPSFALPPLQVSFGGVDEEGSGVEKAQTEDQALTVFDPAEQFMFVL